MDDLLLDDEGGVEPVDFLAPLPPFLFPPLLFPPLRGFLGPRCCLACFLRSASAFCTSDAVGARFGQRSGIKFSSVSRGIFLPMSFSICWRKARSLLQTSEMASPLWPALPVRPMR